MPYSILKPLLPYAAIALLIGAGLWHMRSLEADKERLRGELERKAQQVAALEESLRVVHQYESASGAMRSLWASADDPVGESVVSAPDSARGEATRQVKVAVSTKQDTLAGTSAAGERAPGDTAFVHNIGESRAYRGRIWVTPPGKRLRYRLVLPPVTRKVTATQTIGEDGVSRTYLDVPSELSIETLRAREDSGQPRPRSGPSWFAGWSVQAQVQINEQAERKAELLGQWSAGRKTRFGTVGATLSGGVERKWSGSGVSPVGDVSLFVRW